VLFRSGKLLVPFILVALVAANPDQAIPDFLEADCRYLAATDNRPLEASLDPACPENGSVAGQSDDPALEAERIHSEATVDREPEAAARFRLVVRPANALAGPDQATATRSSAVTLGWDRRAR
jgi:hypothetical protein